MWKTDSDLDIFLNEFIEFLEKNEELKWFGKLDFDISKFNQSQIERLLPMLKGKPFRKISFDKKSLDGEKNINLEKIFSSSCIQQEDKSVTIKAENPDQGLSKILKIEMEDIDSIIIALNGGKKPVRREDLSWERRLIWGMEDDPWLAMGMPESVLSGLDAERER